MTNETQPITGSGTAEQSNEQIQATVADAVEHADPNCEVTTNAPVETELTAGLYGKDEAFPEQIADVPIASTATEQIPQEAEDFNTWAEGKLITLQPVGEQILTGTPEHHYLLAEIEAMGESMEASLAQALRTRCAALRRALGL